MSNRNTKVYDKLTVNGSTSNEEICADLNLPYNPANEKEQCVKETKYFINPSDPIKNNSSNLICKAPDNTDPEQKEVVVKTEFQRPWTRFRTTCVYKNENVNDTFKTITNNIKKLNVRRKAEILQYKQGNRLTKAEKYSNLARGINKFNKKQYAYQTMNRVLRKYTNY